MTVCILPEGERKLKNMNKTLETALLLSSLSVYKGVLKRTVPGAYYKLLCAYDKPVGEFLQAWGNFFALLCDRGYADNLLCCLTEAAMFDENAFSRAAAAGQEHTLPKEVMNAVLRDLSAVTRAGELTPEDILSGYVYREELGTVADTLPRWKNGTPAKELSDITALAGYYHRNGCGMFARYKAFLWQNGDIEPVVHPDSVRLSSLKGYDIPRNIVVQNTLSFLRGTQGNNCLLYGDMGTGKSTTVKAVVNEYSSMGLRIVEIPKDRLGEFPQLAERIAAVPMKFIIFIDDLSFSGEDKSYAQLKAVLEGGIAARPQNSLIYATSNRRHLIKESFADREGDEIHRNDTIQETLSLSDRFGLSVNFSRPGKEEYLTIVHSLAKERGLNLPEEVLDREAEKWAIQKGGRSPRCARQLVAMLETDTSSDFQS